MLRSVVVAALLVGGDRRLGGYDRGQGVALQRMPRRKRPAGGPDDPDHLGPTGRLSLSAAPRLPEGRAQGRSHDADRSKPLQGGRAGARRILRRQALAEDRGAQRLQGGRGDRDDGDQVGRVHELPPGAVSRRFVHSAARGPGTRLSRQDDDGFSQSHPRQQSRHVRPDEHRHARADRRDGEIPWRGFEAGFPFSLREKVAR